MGYFPGMDIPPNAANVGNNGAPFVPNEANAVPNPDNDNVNIANEPEPAVMPEPVTDGKDSDDEDEDDDATHEPENGSESDNPEPINEHNPDEIMDQLYGARNTTHNLRPRKARDYGHMHATVEPCGHKTYYLNLIKTPYGVEAPGTLESWHPQDHLRLPPEHDIEPQRPRDYKHPHADLAHTVMTQMSMKKGIREFGDAGVDAVLVELQQLHDRKVLEPQSADTMTREEKRAALNYLMFLKKKRSGRIKGRGCADGRKQRVHTKKEDASSPTVSIEAVMLSCVIDAEEGRDVAIIDIPGAFMQVDMDELVHMRLDGRMAELLVRIDPSKYEKYTVYENGKPVIYVILKKALYGTLRAALLFWRRLSEQLLKWGFTANPYDPCVVNKDINGKQCTILWHVDDLKISHVDRDVVTSVIDMVDAEFGKEAPLTISRGKVHVYLGMTIDFSSDRKVRFSMIGYLEEILNDLPPEMDGENTTPAASFLFDVDDDCEKLDADASEFFHHNTAKLLFICKRARPDIQTAIAFLCTRVKGPDTDDYKKLTRVMKYLRATISIPLTLEADGSNIIKWWVDASYGVHPDMRSHTGGVLTLGKGAVYATSTRQKIGTKSSTEAELVGVSDVISQVIWTRYFLEAQGYSVSDSVVYQDNQSAMLMEKNGRFSSGKRTRHINIRYFFVTDRIANNELTIEYCPTKEMIADFFTKPLQGTPFRMFRDWIMNANPNDDNNQDYRSVLSIAEAEPWADAGWTKVDSKTKESKLAT
jgi:hypothetical protein